MEKEELRIAEESAAGAVEIFSRGGSLGMAAIKADQAASDTEKKLKRIKEREKSRQLRSKEALLKSKEHDYDIERDFDETNPFLV